MISTVILVNSCCEPWATKRNAEEYEEWLRNPRQKYTEERSPKNLQWGYHDHYH